MFENKSYNSWFEKTSHKLSGNGIWLRGNELNTISISEFEKRNYRVLFTRLSTYKDTTDSFTHKLLYQIAKNTEGIFPDMAFLPPANDIRHFEANNVPWLLPTTTKFHPLLFDLIGFSNSIIQEIINIPTLLKKSNIPIHKSKRISDENIPLIIMGGANAVNCNVLCTDDPLIDGIFIGEDAVQIRNILKICREGKAQKKSKAEILLQLETVDGFFQPDKIHLSNRRIIKKFATNSEQLKDAPVLYSDEASSGTLRISEGCPYFCSFCSESWNRKPYAEELSENLTKAALELKGHSGLNNIELYSFNFNIHSELYSVLWNLSEIYTNTGLKSQRFDHIAQNPEVLKLLQVVGKSSITCGLEGISGRMRRYLHKNLEYHDLLKSIDHLVKSHIRELKIFLIATGKEDNDDFNDFREFLTQINNLFSGLKHKPRIIFSTTPLVRFPLTPLEFEDAPSPDLLKNILEKINSLVKSYGFESRFAADLNEYYLSQILVRATDKKVNAALLNSINFTEFIYYNGISDKFINVFNEQVKIAGINPLDLLKGYNTNQSTIWQLFDLGVDRNYLVKTFTECINFKEQNACFRTKKCNNCKACPDNNSIIKITHSVQKRLYTPEELHKKIVERRKNSTTIDFIVDRRKAASGIPAEYTGIAIARALMLADKKLIPSYHGFKSSFWDPDNKGVKILGDDIISLQWDLQTNTALKENLQNDEFLKQINNNLPNTWGVLKGVITEFPTKYILKISGKFDTNLREYLSQNHLKYTQKRNDSGGYVYEMTKDSLKKELILSLETSTDEINIQVGKKFKLSIFTQKCIPPNLVNSTSIQSKFYY